MAAKGTDRGKAAATRCSPGCARWTTGGGVCAIGLENQPPGAATSPTLASSRVSRPNTHPSPPPPLLSSSTPPPPPLHRVTVGRTTRYVILPPKFESPYVTDITFHPLLTRPRGLSPRVSKAPFHDRLCTLLSLRPYT